MVEPIHGTAPEIAGQGESNPLEAIWPTSQMLAFWGKTDWPKQIITGREQLLVEKKVLTPDFGGQEKTGDVGATVIRLVRRRWLFFYEKLFYKNGPNGWLPDWQISIIISSSSFGIYYVLFDLH